MTEEILETELLEVEVIHSNFSSLIGESIELVITNPDTILIWSTFAICLGIVATVIHLWKYRA